VSSLALTEKGAHVRLDSQCALIYGPDGRVVLTARKHKRTYIIQASVVEPDSAASAFVVSADIVHQKLGHPGQRVSEIYAGQMGAEGEVKDYQVCVQAKQTRGPFPSSDTTTTRPLELIHSDLIGPFQNSSLEGARYALTIMDDCTRFSEVHFLKTKDDVFQILRNTILQWERLLGHKLQSIRPDNETEYMGEFEAWRLKKGILRQFSADYTPEQNGKAERLNRTLLERTGALRIQHQCLLHSGLLQWTRHRTCVRDFQ
jgi:transposase InsO family protein